MSAFIVGDDHIDAMLTYALDKRVSYYVEETSTRVDITTFNATEVGRILMTENERSVRQRYGDDDIDNMTGDETAANYKYRRWGEPLTAVSVLKGCACFDYQACESDDYSKSLAWTIVEAIRHKAINNLPGYSDAKGWEFRRKVAAVCQ